MLREGEWLGRYKIDREIGRGGVAVVYRAADRRGRLVALKVLTQPTALERFQREAVRKLHHPHIIRVYEAGQERGYHYIVMEYAPYGSLDKHLQQATAKNQHLSLAQSLEIAAQVAQGLAYAHQHGLVHRDIKPSNILLDRREGVIRAIITDFGVARYQDGQTITRDGALIGTPEYMSPEQARGHKVDARSDVYALGLVLYHMLSGRPPVQADTPFAALHKQVYESPPPIPHVPAGVRNIIFKAIAKKPEKRYQTMPQMVQALQAAQADPDKIKPQPTPMPAAPWPFNPVYFLVGLVVVIGVLIGLSLNRSGGLVLPSTSSPADSTVAVANGGAPTARLVTAAPSPTPLPPTPTYTSALPPKAVTFPRPSDPTLTAPVLLTLPEGDMVYAGRPATFRWRWDGELPPNTTFEVRIWAEGADREHYGAYDVKSIAVTNQGNGEYEVNFDVAGAWSVQQHVSQEFFYWTAAVVQVEPYVRLGPEARPRTLRIARLE